MELQLSPLNLPSDLKRETEEQVMKTATQLAEKGCHIFRAGVWKPRTKPGGFEGHGEPALKWMAEAKKETGMLVGTEVATPEHVELANKYDMDILWIGARTSANPFAMQALADALQGYDKPVLVKNPVNPDLELWIGALERLNAAVLSIVVSLHTTRPSTATSLCGRFLSSFVVVFLSSLSAVTLHTWVVSVNSSHHFVSRLWTLALTV